MGKTEGRGRQSAEEGHSGVSRHPEDRTHLGWSRAWGAEKIVELDRNKGLSAKRQGDKYKVDRVRSSEGF